MTKGWASIPDVKQEIAEAVPPAVAEELFKIPLDINRGHNYGHPCGAHKNKICLPPELATKEVILHELGHILCRRAAGGEAPHPPEWDKTFEEVTGYPYIGMGNNAKAEGCAEAVKRYLEGDLEAAPGQVLMAYGADRLIKTERELRWVRQGEAGVPATKSRAALSSNAAVERLVGQWNHWAGHEGQIDPATVLGHESSPGAVYKRVRFFHPVTNQDVWVDALIDTGSHPCGLPMETIQALDLPYMGPFRRQLASGQWEDADGWFAGVQLDGRMSPCVVTAGVPIVGVIPLEFMRLKVDPITQDIEAQPYTLLFCRRGSLEEEAWDTKSSVGGQSPRIGNGGAPVRAAGKSSKPMNGPMPIPTLRLCTGLSTAAPVLTPSTPTRPALAVESSCGAIAGSSVPIAEGQLTLAELKRLYCRHDS